ncbi:hypothetical protein EU537_04395 [Candidatus Thorarchaeota archaeon]|nr:MAG: hypothetical protein EU537_04395 [Candidatus Thorarchaeota archaeon]
MDEIMLYRGCTTPVRLPNYEAATIAVLEKLGVKVRIMEDANCCGAQYVESLSRNAYAAMSGRILALAEKEGLDVLAICGACSGSLKVNKHYLDNNDEAKDELNELLADEDLEYSGTTRVRHLLQVFNEDIGFEKIGAAVIRPYNGLKLAAHYGCHVTRPGDIVQVDDPEEPTIIDDLISIVGATPVDYTGKTRCCGGPMLAMDEGIATAIGQDKITNIKKAGAQGVVTACVFCNVQLTQAQFSGEIDRSQLLPTITLPQLLGPAIGIEDDALGLALNRISPETIMNTLGG